MCQLCGNVAPVALAQFCQNDWIAGLTAMDRVTQSFILRPPIDERHAMDSVTSEYWDDRMNANIKHFFFAAQTCSKMMKNNGGGTIVNIGSFSWMMGIGGMICYTTAKSAIQGLTRGLARDLGPKNIRVNCVVPGWIMTERQVDMWLTPESEKELMDRQCIKRKLFPKDISRFVLFMASDEASACSNQSFVVDGGWL